MVPVVVCRRKKGGEGQDCRKQGHTLSSQHAIWSIFMRRVPSMTALSFFKKAAGNLPTGRSVDWLQQPVGHDGRPKVMGSDSCTTIISRQTIENPLLLSATESSRRGQPTLVNSTSSPGMKTTTDYNYAKTSPLPDDMTHAAQNKNGWQMTKLTLVDLAF